MQLLRTDNTNPAFSGLTRQLDTDLRDRYGRKQDGYDRHNVVDHVRTAIVGYLNDQPVACGCFKAIDEETTELKRMYVEPASRGKGCGAGVLQALEQWAAELGYTRMILETGKGQPEAIGLYRKCGYNVMENYEPYQGNDNSVCMQKCLTPGYSAPNKTS